MHEVDGARGELRLGEAGDRGPEGILQRQAPVRHVGRGEGQPRRTARVVARRQVVGRQRHPAARSHRDLKIARHGRVGVHRRHCRVNRRRPGAAAVAVGHPHREAAGPGVRAVVHEEDVARRQLRLGEAGDRGPEGILQRQMPVRQVGGGEGQPPRTGLVVARRQVVGRQRDPTARGHRDLKIARHGRVVVHRRPALSRQPSPARRCRRRRRTPSPRTPPVLAFKPSCTK